MSRLAPWRVAARLARREVRRRPGRTVLVSLLVAVPVLALLVASAVWRTDVAQRDEDPFGRAAVRVEVFGEVGRYTVNRLFTPGDAAMMLIDHFGEVCWHRYDDALRVTNTDHVLDFITSSPPANSATPEQQRQLRDLVLRGMTDGVFHVSKDTGCLVCRRKMST